MKKYRPKIRMKLVDIILFPLIAIVVYLNPKAVLELFKVSFIPSQVMVLVPYIPLALIIWLIYKIIYVIRLSYVMLSYADNDDGNIVKTKGVIGRFRQDIPYKRITNIHKNRNWLYRILGLTQIQIQTAGSDAIEMSLDGLTYDDGEEIYKQLKKFEGIKGDGT